MSESYTKQTNSSEAAPAMATLFRNVMDREIEAIERVFQAVDPAELEVVIKRILACTGTVYLTGAGTSGILARKVAHTLCCVGRPAAYLSPVDAVHGSSGLLRNSDVAILFSKGGETRELRELLGPLVHKGVETVLVTEQPDSTLGRACATLLRTPPVVEVDPDNVIASASITATNALFDAISISIRERTGYTLADFAPTHPGGAVGRKLTVPDLPRDQD